MNHYINIPSTDSIGDSLSAVNLNYSNLEVKTLNIQSNVDNYWTPMLNYYLTYGKFLREISSIAAQYYPLFHSVLTNVQTNSATWCKPITIFYPSIFPSSVNTNTIVNALSGWVNDYFPISKDNTTVYMENQKAIIYSHIWKFGGSISEKQYLYDYTVCQTSNKEVCITCTDYYTGGEWCGYDTWTNCSGGITCTSCGTAYCGFAQPPYIPAYPGQDKVSYGYISADVQMDFQERNEATPILGVVFKIHNCSWTFDKFLT